MFDAIRCNVSYQTTFIPAVSLLKNFCICAAPAKWALWGPALEHGCHHIRASFAPILSYICIVMKETKELKHDRPSTSNPIEAIEHFFFNVLELVHL